MNIESLSLHNFKVFQDIEIRDIPPFAVFVGANGAGKSTLFDVFGFLKDCLTYNVTRALQARGGFREVVSRGHENESIGIEIQYRLSINDKDRLVTYRVEIALVNNRPSIVREVLRYKRSSYGSPYHFLDFSYGKGYAVTNEEDFDKEDEALDREEHNLEAQDILAIKGLGQFEKFKAASALRQTMENWHVSDFHIGKARGSKDAIGEYEHLSASGDNLQLVAKNLIDNHRSVYDAIVAAMKRRVPGVTAITPQETVDGRLVLQFGNSSFKDPFIDRYVSDGTLKMFAYLVLLYDPRPHPFLCVEEPENQLYPRLLGELAEEFRIYAQKGGQVMVSSHSPDFLNAVELDEVFWLEKEENGFTRILRARDDAQVAVYMAEGDKMGELWKQGFFGRVDPQ